MLHESTIAVICVIMRCDFTHTVKTMSKPLIFDIDPPVTKQELTSVAKQYSISTKGLTIRQLYDKLLSVNVLDKIVLFNTSGFIESLIGVSDESTDTLTECDFSSIRFVKGVGASSASDSD